MRDVVTYEIDGRTAIITINRANKLNALDEEVIQGLRAALLRFADGQERCAVLAAEGDRAFSVGADIKNPPKEMWQGVPGVGVVTDKPIIACVQGYCVGGAYVLVQMCDLAVAADNTVFKYPEAQVGFTGGLIAGAAAKIPHKLAMEFMLLGQDLSAQRALQIGMVNRVVPLGEQMAAAMEFARILEDSAPLVVQTIKNLVTDTLPRGPAEISALIRDKLLTVRDSDDGAEGRAAFAEKRKPDFNGS
ncbi:MAG TPA: enoyl-CoA hydratase [Gammaproteobacteria bacterium]|nr:enoyl-CoA hydratase [Gammaproteobacteria bacterium]|tara:strand:+ start:967 stop:1707 length:741 start_codon:yes stop_codon:yes gene_type:complete